MYKTSSLFSTVEKKTISPPISFYDNFRVLIAWWTDTGQSRSILEGPKKRRAHKKPVGEIGSGFHHFRVNTKAKVLFSLILYITYYPDD